MTRLRWLLALPALIFATSGPAMAAEIRDKAGLFSAEAVKKARADLDQIEREYSVPIRIETVQTLNGESIDDALRQHAKAADAHGLYVLIARKEHKTEVGESRSFSKYLTRPRTLAIREAINHEFVKGDFDAGLTKGIDKTDSILSEARAEAGGSLRPTAPAGRRATPVPGVGGAAIPGKPSSFGGLGTLLTIVLGILAVFVVIRILGALFSGGNRGGYAGQQRMMGPGGGQGGPGYGPGYGGGGGGGGGGFMSSMFGGIGGALAGNWLYDQFSGRHHDSSVGQSNYDPGVATPEAPANDDFVTPGDGGGDWGGGGADVGGGGGGDWGGGGGDAGGGGGDWGGGGGGDWGGGGGGDDGGGGW